MQNQTLTIIDAQRSIELEFEKGENLLDVLKRNIHYNSPCGGRGMCGACKVEIKQNDGTFKTELACFLDAKPGMVVKVRAIHLLTEIRSF